MFAYVGKKIVIAEYPVTQNIQSSLRVETVCLFSEFKAFLAGLPSVSRWFLVFHLCGPCFLSIGHRLVHLCLSVWEWGLVFFGRSAWRGDWGWLNNFWVYSASCRVYRAASFFLSYVINGWLFCAVD